MPSVLLVIDPHSEIPMSLANSWPTSKMEFFGTKKMEYTDCSAMTSIVSTSEGLAEAYQIEFESTLMRWPRKSVSIYADHLIGQCHTHVQGSEALLDGELSYRRQIALEDVAINFLNCNLI